MKYLIFYVSVVIFVEGHDYICSDRFPLITDLSPEDCNNEHNYYYKENVVHGCFPACVFIDPGHIHTWCNKDSCPPGYYCPDGDEQFCQLDEENEHAWCNKDSCLPGYYCPDGVKQVCQLDEDSCFKYFVSDKNVIWTRALWKPTCLANGEWAPKQCKGEPANGRCFCFDPVGNRIFGQEFSTRAQNMTCACSRRRAELEAAGDRFHISLHCDSMGNYEPLQCDSGQCWCVEPKTGKITHAVVPELLMSHLPCYDKAEVGGQYLRQCESHQFAHEKIRNEFKTHGTMYTNFRDILCDADGSYGAYKISNGIAYCVWRDNTIIGSWQSPVNLNILKLNCNCARDTKIFEIEGLTQMLQCSENGNYSPLQQAKLKYFCVDNDGFIKSDYYDEIPECDKYP